ncbi:MAG TPA: RNA 3'-terminal phosphate cyclase [Longimicrobiales bacterium]|nr:RNA 3'-terminal phosphate cyclase [Longimicrobiales bacterium]
MLILDGSAGEGGGQILRSALSLSSVTGRSFRMERIRAGRSRPGLGRQHRTAVLAAAEVSGADVGGAELGSTEIEFRPVGPRSGSYHFDVGTAGSATLVFQTVLPILLAAEGASTVVLEGGTHNPFAPPFEFLERAFLPLVERTGPRIAADLERPGFYPAGGGRFRARVEPRREAPRSGLRLSEPGPVLGRALRVWLSDLPASIARREVETARELLGDRGTALRVEVLGPPEPRGPGNAVLLEVRTREVTEVFASFGKKGKPAEVVAREAVAAARAWEASGAAVGAHLADQLLVPLALGAGGTYTTVEPTLHTRTNAAVIRRFLGVEPELREEGAGRWRIEVAGTGA